jgi:hypothetical protein
VEEDLFSTSYGARVDPPSKVAQPGEDSLGADKKLSLLLVANNLGLYLTQDTLQGIKQISSIASL